MILPACIETSGRSRLAAADKDHHLAHRGELIPEFYRPAIDRALEAAFGATSMDDVRQLTLGMSKSLNFRIVVQGTPYLLRVTARADERSDPARHVAYAKAAADAGIAPRVRHASAEDGILITDFVDARPFPEDAALRIGRVIRILQTLHGWPSRMGYFDVVERFVGRFRSSEILPETLKEELCRRYAAAAHVYPHHAADLVVNHNDLKADNILFDGERIWFVDWEAAFLNDRYVDLAVAANFFVRDEAQEGAFLGAYFERPATEYERARFFLMRQIVHTFAAAFCVLLASSSEPHLDLNTPPDEFDEFHRRLMTGEINLAGGKAQMRYARVHLDRALQNGRTRRFEDALALVAAGDA